MINLSQHGFSHEEVERKLKNEWLSKVQFRLELMRNGSKLMELKKHSCSIWCDSTTEVKYGAKAVIDHVDLNPNTDMIRPVMLVKDGGREFEFNMIPLRIITANSQVTKLKNGYQEVIVIEALDNTCIPQNSSIGENLFIPAGTLYTSEIERLIKLNGFEFANIKPSDKVVAYNREEWESSATILAIVNSLASEINYRTLEVDKDGIPFCREYQAPDIGSISINYDIRSDKVIYPDKESTFDSWGKPNVFKATVFTPDMVEPISVVYENTDPIDPSSLVNNPFRIIKIIENINDVADYESLYETVRRIATETAQSYEYAAFKTDIMPHHEVGEIIRLHSTGLTGVYEEVAWSIDDFSPSGSMTHTVRRVY